MILPNVVVIMVAAGCSDPGLCIDAGAGWAARRQALRAGKAVVYACRNGCNCRLRKVRRSHMNGLEKVLNEEGELTLSK